MIDVTGINKDGQPRVNFRIKITLIFYNRGSKVKKLLGH